MVQKQLLPSLDVSSCSVTPTWNLTASPMCGGWPFIGCGGSVVDGVTYSQLTSLEVRTVLGPTRRIQAMALDSCVRCLRGAAGEAYAPRTRA